MACTSGNMGTDVTVSPDGNNVLQFVPATDTYPFEDTDHGTFTNSTWWVQELHYGSNVVTVGRTSSSAQPNFVTNVSFATSFIQAHSRLQITFDVDTDLVPSGITEILIGVASTSSTTGGEITGQFCLTLNRGFTFLDDNTVFLVTPDGITGSPLTSWADESVHGNDLNTTDADFAPTQPTTTTGDADFGNAVIFDSNNDHRATIDIVSDLQDHFAGSDPVCYIWFVAKTTDTGGAFWDWQDFNVDGGDAQLMTIFAGKMRLTYGTGNTVTSTTTINDGTPHLVECKLDLANNAVSIHVDGNEDEDTDTYAGSLAGTNGNDNISVGRFSTSFRSAAFTMAVLKIDDALPSAARKTAIREYCRDNLGCSGIA